MSVQQTSNLSRDHKVTCSFEIHPLTNLTNQDQTFFFIILFMSLNQYETIPKFLKKVKGKATAQTTLKGLVHVITGQQSLPK